MLNAKMQEALNKQLNAELFSSYLYLSMAAYFESQSLAGMAAWMEKQSAEEYGHAMKFYSFINERHGRVNLTQVETPRTEWNSPLEVFEESFRHEQKISGLINHLVKLAIDEGDYAAHTFLQWFINEQVEEESTVLAIVDKLKLVGDHGVAIFMLDNELGQRGGASVSAASAT